MNQMMLGDPAVFSIEYRPYDPVILCGGIRIWMSSKWLGNIESPEILGSLAEDLNYLRAPRRSKAWNLFARDSDVPAFDALRRRTSWSFGEAFDDFEFVYYAVQESQCIHWNWRAHDALLRVQPDYPQGMHCATVPFEVYDAVVGEFLRVIKVPDDVRPGFPWAFDPRRSS